MRSIEYLVKDQSGRVIRRQRYEGGMVGAFLVVDGIEYAKQKIMQWYDKSPDAMDWHSIEIKVVRK